LIYITYTFLCFRTFIFCSLNFLFLSNLIHVVWEKTEMIPLSNFPSKTNVQPCHPTNVDVHVWHMSPWYTSALTWLSFIIIIIIILMIYFIYICKILGWPKPPPFGLGPPPLGFEVVQPSLRVKVKIIIIIKLGFDHWGDSASFKYQNLFFFFFFLLLHHHFGLWGWLRPLRVAEPPPWATGVV